MTPIEAMAKAFWDFQGMSEWDEAENWQKRPAIAGMRSALLALAECELDAKFIRQNSQAFVGDTFTAMLRSIANGGGNMCQAGSTAACEPVSASPLQSGDGGEAGIQIDMLGGNCPVQADGLIDGEPFYFRARWDSWSLSIGSDYEDHSSIGKNGRDVVGRPRWFYEEDYGDGPYDAGWMPEDDARKMIAKGAALFRAAISQSPDEEAQRADTDGTASPDASLTHKT